MKTTTIKSRLQYEKPVSNEIKFRVRRMICTSFGESGAAGSDGEVIGGPDDEY